MRAAAIQAHGGPEQLELMPDFPDPTPRPGDVIVGVKAASLNYHDVFTRRGMPGIKLNLPVIPGLDIAGEIAEVGSEVTGWSVGDRVLVDPVNRVEGGLMGETVHGGLAEYCRVPAHQLVRIPHGVTFDQAASLPVAYGTAHRMMVTIGKIKAGEKVLVLGASGGVGTSALLLAKMRGAFVIAAAGTDEKCDHLRALGADETHLWHWQSLAYSAHLRQHRIPAQFIATPGDHHFDITDRLGNARDPLTRALIAQMGL